MNSDMIIISIVVGIIIVFAIALGIVSIAIFFNWLCGDLLPQRRYIRQEKDPSD